MRRRGSGQATAASPPPTPAGTPATGRKARDTSTWDLLQVFSPADRVAVPTSATRCIRFTRRFQPFCLFRAEQAVAVAVEPLEVFQRTEELAARNIADRK